jgi:hypothetical protein
MIMIIIIIIIIIIPIWKKKIKKIKFFPMIYLNIHMQMLQQCE